MCRSAWTCIASAPRSRSWTPPVTSRATATSAMTRSSWCRSLACCRRARRSPSRPPTAGLAGGVAGGTGAGTAPGPPQPLQGDCLGQAQQRQGRCAHPGQLLRADLLPEAWIAPLELCDLRALLRHRASLVRLATGLKNRVRAVLADRGISPPWSLWATPGRAWLAGAGAAANPTRDRRGLLGGAGCPGQPDRPPGGESARWPRPTHGSRPAWPCPASAS
jgi:hypothetical protein